MMKSINDNMCIKELVDNCIMGICKRYNELVCIGTLVLAARNVQSNGTTDFRGGKNRFISRNEFVFEKSKSSTCLCKLSSYVNLFVSVNY